MVGRCFEYAVISDGYGHEWAAAQHALSTTLDTLVNDPNPYDRSDTETSPLPSPCPISHISHWSAPYPCRRSDWSDKSDKSDKTDLTGRS